MKTPVIPQTYAQWHHCITVECGIPLTRTYVEERSTAWKDATSDESRRFEQLYGRVHRERIRQWFEQALEGL